MKLTMTVSEMDRHGNLHTVDIEVDPVLLSDATQEARRLELDLALSLAKLDLALSLATAKLKVGLASANIKEASEIKTERDDTFFLRYIEKGGK